MTANLRLLSIKVLSNVKIRAFFSASLIKNLDLENISISSETINVPDPEVLSLQVKDDNITIECRPFTALAVYSITFSSSSDITFKSLNGDAVLFEDGIANKSVFIGPVEESNVVKDYLLSYLKENVYNIDPGSIIHDYISSLAVVLSKALYDIRQAKNDNYLSFNVIDELKTRGETAFDRLDEEGAYEITRVGRRPTGAISPLSLDFDFTLDPITLLKASYSENLDITSSEDISASFDKNTFILNLSKNFVTKVNSLISLK